MLAGLRRGRGDEVEHGQGEVGVAVLLDRRREVTQHGGRLGHPPAGEECGDPVGAVGRHPPGVAPLASMASGPPTVDRRRGVPRVDLQECEVGQGGRLARPVAEQAPDGDALAEQLARPLVLAEGPVNGAQPVERQGLPVAVTRLPPQRQRPASTSREASSSPAAAGGARAR